jgi:hypothetical protein
MVATNISRFEQFFRQAAGIDVDKNDLKRHDDFVDQKLYDLLLRGEANAKANSRDVIELWDLPITKGLQERVHEFDKLDRDIQLSSIFERITAFPPMDLACSDEAWSRLTSISGGMSIALARTMKVIDPAMKNPATTHWERAMQVFDLLQ